MLTRGPYTGNHGYTRTEIQIDRAMPIGRYYRRGILISEEHIELEKRERQTRLDEIENGEKAQRARAAESQRARG